MAEILAQEGALQNAYAMIRLKKEMRNKDYSTVLGNDKFFGNYNPKTPKPRRTRGLAWGKWQNSFSHSVAICVGGVYAGFVD